MNASLRYFDNIADRVRQHRQASSTPILLVEGPDDYLVLRRHLESVDIFPAGGKRPALEAADRLQGWNVNGFMCVIDRDFDDPIGADLVPYVRYYEGADLEAMLTELGVLEVVVEHFASAGKLEKSGGAAAIVAIVVEQARSVARLRRYSSRHKLGLSFASVDICSKADKNSLVVDINRLCAALTAKTGCPLGAADLIDALSSCDVEEQYSGKDAVALVGLALRGKIATMPHGACSREVLIKALHSSAAMSLSESSWIAALRATLSRGA